MKKLLTITALFLSVMAFGQSKGDKWTIDTSALKAATLGTGKAYFRINDKINTSILIYKPFSLDRDNKPDTIACYFMIVPMVIKDPLHQLPTEWYLGWRINSFSYYLSHLYYNKQPVKEQVLISIPKK